MTGIIFIRIKLLPIWDKHLGWDLHLIARRTNQFFDDFKRQTWLACDWKYTSRPTKNICVYVCNSDNDNDIENRNNNYNNNNNGNDDNENNG